MYIFSLENVECEREVEFRSYEILLNLNEGDTLREVQTLEEKVRNHPRYSKQSFFSRILFVSKYMEFFGVSFIRLNKYLSILFFILYILFFFFFSVVHALNIFYALNSNNYVR